MTEHADPPFPGPILLEAVAAEIEAFVGQAGWDQAPSLYALVPTRALAADPAAAKLLAADPGTAEPLAADPGTAEPLAPGDPAEIPAEAITPIAQEPLPPGPLDEALARIGWPPEVVGCALCQEIVMLPPDAEAELADLDIDAATSRVAEHPERRDARLVVAVLRGGQAASILRLRGNGDAAEDLLTGPDLAPNLVSALAATLLD